MRRAKKAENAGQDGQNENSADVSAAEGDGFERAAEQRGSEGEAEDADADRAVPETEKRPDLWAEGQRLVAEQLRQINLLEPGAGSFEGLMGMENFEEFDRLVRGGLDMVTAFKAASYGTAARKSAAVAKRAALSAAAGKRHMTRMPTASAVGEGEEIPAAALGIWREMFPKEDMAGLRKRYNRALKGEWS